ncbi:RNA polymerase subunit sigma, partial [Vibrio xuii]
KIQAEELRLTDLITGFVDPDAEETTAPTATHIGSELAESDLEDEDEEDADENEEKDEDDSDEEEDTGIDPELALEKFTALRNTFQNFQLACNEYGKESPKAQIAHELVLDVFKEFRL